MNKKQLEVYNADAFQQIKKFGEMGLKVDHIITDPPYNISKSNNFDTMKSPRNGVDFGEWDNGKFNLYSWIPDYSKLLNKDGSMIIFCSYRYISYIIDALESDASGMIVKDILIWQKSNPMPRNINRRYVQDMEFAIWAVKKKSKWVFNKPGEKPYLRGLFSTSTVSGKEKVNHPTQKSIKLMENLVSIHTDAEQVILDPFMGSGSTGVAALKLNRKFIGIEKDEEFYEIAKERLEKEVIVYNINKLNQEML
ncbi:MAG: site-specific DNA-methyltransferase [Lachnospiraceae bacterium]